MSRYSLLRILPPLLLATSLSNTQVLSTTIEEETSNRLQGTQVINITDLTAHPSNIEEEDLSVLKSIQGANSNDLSVNILDEIDVNKLVKKGVVKGVSFIPEIGPYLSIIVDLIWPDKKDDSWKKLVNQLRKEIKQAQLETIQDLLKNEIKHRMLQVESVVEHIKKHKKKANEPYMRLAQSFDALDVKFGEFTDDTLNFKVLPLYSTTVLTEILYWTVAVYKKRRLLS